MNKARKSGARASGKNRGQAGPVILEMLESRQMMSVSVHAGVASAPHGVGTAVKVTPLTAPTGLSAVASSPISVSLSWTDNDQTATGYLVQRSTDGKTYVSIATLNQADASSYTDNSAVSGHVNYYRVRAITGTNASAFSAAAAVTTAPMAAPSGLTASANSPINISLSWTDNESTATGYLVQRSIDGKTFATIATLNSADADSYTDAAAYSGRANYYRVRAFAGANSSAFTAVASVTTAALAAPSALAAAASAPNTVSLTWTDNDANATGYVVQRSTDGKTFVNIATLNSAVAASYTDNAAASGHTNYYRVRAVVGANTSAYSELGSAVTPMATSTGLLANAVTATSIKLTWSKNDVSATGVNILRSTDGVTFVKIATLGKVLTYTDTSVSPSTTYQYKVQGFNAGVSAEASNAATAITPLGPSKSLTAVAAGLTQADLTWTDTDTDNATGYYVLRTVDGKTFVRLATLTGSSVNSYSDTAVVSGGTYTYEIQAFSDSGFAAASPAVKILVPVGAATGLSASAAGPTSVSLTWSITDSSVTGYNILRSTDGKTYSLLTSIKQPLATSYTDNAALSGKKFYYKVQAFKGTVSAAATDAATVITPLNAVTNLVAAANGLSVKLTWTNADKDTTGFYVLRSLDGVTFSAIATLKSTTLTYTDAQLTGDQTYSYKIQSYNAVATSEGSSVASATPNGTSVSIATRYTNELVITAIGSNDSISISQSGDSLSILADGKSFSATVSSGGVFIYTRSGTDTIDIDSSVTAYTTVETIDACNTTIHSAGAQVSLWMDSTDTFSGTGTVHRVANFTGNVSKATGAYLANPTDSGATKKVNASLWGSGPVADDVNQGAVGDCYFMASLAAFAGVRANVLHESAVDMGDGTFAVQFFNTVGGAASFVRVSNDFSTGGFAGFKFAYPGDSGSIWAMVMEKAFCSFRTGKNTYASINSGWMGSVYTNLGINSTWFDPATQSDDSLYNIFASGLASGEPITLATYSNAPNLVGSHAYTLVGVSTDENGVHHYLVRNPWGQQGDALENSDGYASLTYAQLKANYSAVALATT